MSAIIKFDLHIYFICLLPISKEPSPDGDFTIAVPVEEGSRTAYNHTPQVKILKRNPSGNGSEAANSR